MLMRPSTPHPSDDDQARPAPFFLDVSCPDADTLVVVPVGEADLCTVPDLRRALIETTGAGPSNVIVDLDRLTFMDASIFSVLIAARQRLSATGGTFQVRCRTPHGRRLLSLTGLDGNLDPGA